jgi:hypothetical protein
MSAALAVWLGLGLGVWASTAAAAGDGARPGGAGFTPMPSLPRSTLPGGAAPDAGPAGPEPGRGTPPFLAVPAFRVHLFLDEELDVDALRRLARPDATAWVRTRSNMLRESLLERLPRFGGAFVQLRAPLLDTHAAQLGRAARAGAWLSPHDLTARGMHRLIGRQVAVSLFGALRPADLAVAQQAKVDELRWTPGPSDLSLDAWGRLAQAPGRKVVVWSGALPEGCDRWPRGRASAAPILRVTLGSVGEAVSAMHRCPLVARVLVPPSLDDVALSQLFAANPRLELEVEVGRSPELAAQAAALLDRLGARQVRPSPLDGSSEAATP